MGGDSFGFGLLRRRVAVVPTLRGLILCALVVLVVGICVFRSVQPFLAVNRPIGGDVLVMEGWIPDYAMREALIAFRTHPYKMMIATGGPMPQGMVYSTYGTYAEFGAATLKDFGLGADSIITVPSPNVGRDRTHQEGVSLRAWLGSHPGSFASLDVFSFSSHARRTRLLYRMALGPDVKVGVYSSRDLGYDPAGWWKTSNGVRQVSDEVFAYLYAKLLFRG